MTADAIIARLGEQAKARRSGDGWSCRCPAHEDGNKSLSVSPGKKGGTVVHCFAGCPPEAVCSAAGISLARAGLVATCNPGGAGKWLPEFTQHFCGADIVIIPDRDEAGRRHGQEVAREFQGSAASIRHGNSFDPTPVRVRNTAWRQPLQVHSESLIATESFTTEVATRRRERDTSMGATARISCLALHPRQCSLGSILGRGVSAHAPQPTTLWLWLSNRTFSSCARRLSSAKLQTNGPREAVAFKDPD